MLVNSSIGNNHMTYMPYLRVVLDEAINMHICFCACLVYRVEEGGAAILSARMMLKRGRNREREVVVNQPLLFLLNMRGS